MPEIGCEAWVDACNRAVADVDAGDVRVSVRHQIVDGPSWVVRVAGGRVTFAADRRDTDLTFTWERADAETVARGDTSALAPFQAGRLRVGGDLRLLAGAAELFARFPAVPATADA